jgi:hypothetical protein
MSTQKFVCWPPGTPFLLNGIPHLKLTRPIQVVGLMANAVIFEIGALKSIPENAEVETTDPTKCWVGIELVPAPWAGKNRRAIQLAQDYRHFWRGGIFNAITVGNPTSPIFVRPKPAFANS